MKFRAQRVHLGRTLHDVQEFEADDGAQAWALAHQDIDVFSGTWVDVRPVIERIADVGVTTVETV